MNKELAADLMKAVTCQRLGWGEKLEDETFDPFDLTYDPSREETYEVTEEIEWSCEVGCESAGKCLAHDEGMDGCLAEQRKRLKVMVSFNPTAERFEEFMPRLTESILAVMMGKEHSAVFRAPAKPVKQGRDPKEQATRQQVKKRHSELRTLTTNLIARWDSGDSRQIERLVSALEDCVADLRQMHEARGVRL